MPENKDCFIFPNGYLNVTDPTLQWRTTKRDLEKVCHVRFAQ
jgi:hypothetical protein